MLPRGLGEALPEITGEHVGLVQTISVDAPVPRPLDDLALRRGVVEGVVMRTVLIIPVLDGDLGELVQPASPRGELVVNQPKLIVVFEKANTAKIYAL